MTYIYPADYLLDKLSFAATNTVLYVDAAYYDGGQNGGRLNILKCTPDADVHTIRTVSYNSAIYSQGIMVSTLSFIVLKQLCDGSCLINAPDFIYDKKYKRVVIEEQMGPDFDTNSHSEYIYIPNPKGFWGQLTIKLHH